MAVKLLRSDSKTKSSAVARFRREARAAGSINSDHVTQVLDVEEDAEAAPFVLKIVSYQHPDHDTETWPPENHHE